MSSRVAAVDRTVAAEQVDSEPARDSLLPLALLTPLLLVAVVRRVPLRKTPLPVDQETILYLAPLPQPVAVAVAVVTTMD